MRELFKYLGGRKTLSDCAPIKWRDISTMLTISAVFSIEEAMALAKLLEEDQNRFFQMRKIGAKKCLVIDCRMLRCLFENPEWSGYVILHKDANVPIMRKKNVSLRWNTEPFWKKNSKVIDDERLCWENDANRLISPLQGRWRELSLSAYAMPSLWDIQPSWR